MEKEAQELTESCILEFSPFLELRRLSVNKSLREEFVIPGLLLEYDNERRLNKPYEMISHEWNQIGEIYLLQ